MISRYRILTYIFKGLIVMYDADYSDPRTKSGKRTRKSIQKAEQGGYDGSSFSPNLERKLESITAGLGPAFFNILHTISDDNVSTVANYILEMKTEANLSDSLCLTI